MKNIFSTKQTILIVLSLGLYLLGFFSSFPYLLEFERESSSKIDTIRNVIEYSIMFLSFLVFSIYFIRKNVFSKITIHLLVIVLMLNFSLSASCFFIYKQGFNVGMMLSILETNTSEVFSMLKTLVFPMLATIVFYALLLLTIKGGG